MGVRALDGDRRSWRWAGGALWAIPVIAVTALGLGVLLRIFPVVPVSPLPPTGDPTGFAISLLAGVDRGALRRGDPVPGVRDHGVGPRARAIRRGLVLAALVFAFAHVLTISGTNAGDAFGLAVVGFASARMPVALALGWIFLRRGTIWASFGSTPRSTGSC